MFLIIRGVNVSTVGVPVGEPTQNQFNFEHAGSPTDSKNRLKLQPFAELRREPFKAAVFGKNLDFDSSLVFVE